ncbi:MAG: hypothetical protein QM538_02345 [Methylacidiphilales bacterium]|nr:hypothetical protein [Candidatus Methylacidiphilales bacterium]
MPHATIQYNQEIAKHLNIALLCEALRDCLACMKDSSGKAVFPLGAIRVFALKAEYDSVADGKRAYPFLFVHLIIAPGRSKELIESIGFDLTQRINSECEILATSTVPWGATLQIAEFVAPDYRLGSLRNNF